MVECLTRDRRAAGSSLTGVTALWSLSKTHLSWLSTGSTQEDSSRITERLLSGRKESNQTNKQTGVLLVFRTTFYCMNCLFRKFLTSVMYPMLPRRAVSTSIFTISLTLYTLNAICCCACLFTNPVFMIKRPFICK